MLSYLELFYVNTFTIVNCTGKVPSDDKHPLYFPPELVSQGSKESKGTYYCYLIELNENFDSDIPVCNIILVMGSELESDISSLDFDLEVDRGLVTMKLKYIGELDLTPELVSKLSSFWLGGYYRIVKYSNLISIFLVFLFWFTLPGPYM